VCYHNEKGLGSTIVDLRNFETCRVGCVYDEIAQIIKDKFEIDLKGIMATKG
jgi:hypothetical protein